MSEAEQALTGLVVKWWRAYLNAEDRIGTARALCLDVAPVDVPPAAASEAYRLATDVLDALDDVDGDDGE